MLIHAHSRATPSTVEGNEIGSIATASSHLRPLSRVLTEMNATAAASTTQTVPAVSASVALLKKPSTSCGWLKMRG